MAALHAPIYTHIRLGSMNALDSFAKSESMPSSDLTSNSNSSSEAKVADLLLPQKEELPGPPNPPLVWSETRQELCESLPWYRAFQAGSYVRGIPHQASIKPHPQANGQQVVKGSLVLGYLLAGWPSKRDIWAHHGKVIISHGGGKNLTDDDDPVKAKQHTAASSSGPSTLKDDQSDQQSTIASLKHTMKTRSPLLLIAGDNYALLPFKLNCAFAVMGWYIITDAWTEKEFNPDLQSFVRWKFRFEWVEAQGEPWWIPSPDRHRPFPWDPRERIELFEPAERKRHKQQQAERLQAFEPPPQPEPGEIPNRKRLRNGPMVPLAKVVSCFDVIGGSDTSSGPSSRNCASCGRSWPLVFQSCWMCLQPDCPLFFTPEVPVRLQDLDANHFAESFLALRGDAVTGGFPGGREPFAMAPEWPSDDNTDQARGLWCTRCGRLSCRATIYLPLCAHCDRPVGPSKPLPRVPVPHLTGESANPLVAACPGVRVETTRQGGLIAYSFFFPPHLATDCAVHVIQADLEQGFKEKEADALFKRYQKGAWPPSRSPENSPKMALDYVLNSTGRRLIPFRRHPLSRCGMKGQMLTQQFTCNYGMAYKHVVAMGTNPLDDQSPKAVTGSLELIKQRTALVCPVQDGWFTENGRPLQDGFNELYPVLYMDHQKMSFHDDGEPGLGPIVSSLSLGGEATMRFRIKAKYIVDAPGRKRQSVPQEGYVDLASKDRVVLTLSLRHGSVCVQQGDNLQRKFEHMVTPNSFRIACTARLIDPAINSLPPKRR